MLREPIFIGGVPRSGTTLVRMILDSHSGIACGPELRVAPHVCQLVEALQRQLSGGIGGAYRVSRNRLDHYCAELLSSFLEPSLRLSGKRRVAEKTPANALWFVTLRELFPDAKQIHVVRDGRDVVASLLGQDWRDGRTGELFDFVRDPRAAARLWVRQTEVGQAALATTGAAGIELRYEDIVRQPRATLRRLFVFLGEPWEEAVLDFHTNPRAFDGENETSAPQVSRPLYAASIGRWRSALTLSQLDAVNDVAGPRLRELGYADAA